MKRLSIFITVMTLMVSTNVFSKKVKVSKKKVGKIKILKKIKDTKVIGTISSSQESDNSSCQLAECGPGSTVTPVTGADECSQNDMVIHCEPDDGSLTLEYDYKGKEDWCCPK